MKVIEALSWSIFVICKLSRVFVSDVFAEAFEVTFFLIIMITLTTRAVVFGRYYAWREHVSQLGWFGELPGYPTEAVYPRTPGYGAGAYGQPYPTGANYVQQLPGHSIVVQPGLNGGQPTVTQMQGIVTTA